MKPEADQDIHLVHGQTGAARNYTELHPVTGVRFIAGCA
jgi:hypothetical protein